MESIYGMFSTSNVPAKWNTAGELLVRCWDDECVVYNVASGATHLLSAAATTVLRSLQGGPADAAELASRIAGSLEVEADHSLIASVETILQDFSLLGIIKPLLH